MDKTEIVIQNYVKDDIHKHFEACEKLLINAYELGFKRGAEKQKNTANWIRATSQTLPYGETIQMLICDDSGDKPRYYVDAGTCYGEICIVDNDLLHGDLIAWKRLDSVPSIEICKELR